MLCSCPTVLNAEHWCVLSACPAATGGCTCSAERKKEVLAHLASESSHHATKHPTTAWTFAVSLPHHIRWVFATLETSSSLKSAGNESTRRYVLVTACCIKSTLTVLTLLYTFFSFTLALTGDGYVPPRWRYALYIVASSMPL